MSKESKDFLKKYWQAIVLAVSIQFVIVYFGNIGAYQVVLYKIEQLQETNQSQSHSIFQLQNNQTYIYAKCGFFMPHQLTNTRGGNNE